MVKKTGTNNKIYILWHEIMEEKKPEDVCAKQQKEIINKKSSKKR